MKKRKWLIITVIALLIICGGYYIVKNVYQPIIVLSGSMEPNYHMYQICILDKTPKEYEAGDVIYFYDYNSNHYMIKRIVAKDGDTITINDTKLYVNNAYSPYFKDKEFTYDGILKDTIKLEHDEYFVLGDTPSSSKDSRYVEIGVINADQIIGKLK